MYRIGIDMGGTHTAIGLVNGLELVDFKEFSTDTQHGVSVFISDLEKNLKDLLLKNQLGLEDIESVGMGIPGSFNMDTGIMEYANNLGLSDVPIQKLLQERLARPVYLDNDANLAALGEYLLCASQSKSFLMVTLGTGIGAGIILNGQIYRGINFAEGELGHMSIDYGGNPCNCGRRGCFETYASASALLDQARTAMEKHPESLLWDLIKDPKELNGKIFFQAVKEEDRTALQVRDQYSIYLAEGLTNIINILQVEELVIGGGISKAHPFFLPQTCEKVSEMIYSKLSNKNTIIRPAKYGNDAGIIGAANLN